MKKVLMTIVASVICFLTAATPTVSVFADYQSDLAEAKKIEEYCSNQTDWRSASYGNIDCKDACAETSLSGTPGTYAKLSCDHNGVRVKEKLKLVIDILSVIVAAVGVMAITAVGIIYLTAGPDVGKAVKARTRLIEIIIGLVVYALIYTILNFLIPNFS
jgi:hypothetical protein